MIFAFLLTIAFADNENITIEACKWSPKQYKLGH